VFGCIAVAVFVIHAVTLIVDIVVVIVGVVVLLLLCVLLCSFALRIPFLVIGRVTVVGVARVVIVVRYCAIVVARVVPYNVCIIISFVTVVAATYFVGFAIIGFRSTVVCAVTATYSNVVAVAAVVSVMHCVDVVVIRYVFVVVLLLLVLLLL